MSEKKEVEGKSRNEQDSKRDKGTKTEPKKLIDPVDKIKKTPQEQKKKPSNNGERRSVTGIKKRVQAERCKIMGREYNKSQPGAGRLDMVAARRLEREAEPFLKPLEPVQVGTGNEALPQQCETSYIEYLRDTLKDDPSQINMDASLRRTQLAGDALVLEMALDASETIQAQNSLEKMLAHQMAACHHMSMRLMARANSINEDTDALQRITNTAVRLMNTYQKLFQTLHKLRTGGRQVVTVQHVNVEDGGQAVVAGEVKAGGGEPSKGKGEDVKKSDSTP